MDNASASPLIEEKEQVMVSEKGRCLRKTHFLKPFSTSFDGSVAKLPRRYQRLSDSSLQLKRLSLRDSFSGFWVADPHFVSWLGKMETLYKPIWKKAGIFDAIKVSTYTITKNPSLILSIAQKWCSETKSFVFPWGEATITLEDVMLLLGFSVLGSPVFAPLESSEMRFSAKKLERVRVKNMGMDKLVSLQSWTWCFLGKGDEMEHEAFLVLWLSLFVFPGSCRRSISRHVIPIAVRLARGERIALAPAVLAFLYRDLGQLCNFVRGKCAGKVNLKSLFKLVQVWTWERFKNVRPKAREIPRGEPRIAQWDNLQQISKKNVRLCFDHFDWRPYTKPLKDWSPRLFYLEDAMWLTLDDSVDEEFASFARCVTVSQLVGDGFVEDYLPNRVARQFGLAQDLPSLVTHSNFTEKEAWVEYNKPLDGLNLYMPSRLDQGSVTARYQDWWLNSVSDSLVFKEMQKESIKALNARDTLDHHDKDDLYDGDIDVSPKVLPLTLNLVVQKLEKGFPAKCRRSRTRRLAKRHKISEPVHIKRACKDDDESHMDEEADDNMTIAQVIRSRKKFSGVEKTGGDASESLRKRTRRYLGAESDDDSWPCQKLASIIKVKQRSEGEDKIAKKPEITRQTWDDVNGSNSEKTMIDVATKEAESWLHEEDVEIKRWNAMFCSEVKKQDDIDERLRKRKLGIEKIALDLETRMIKMEKSLAKIIKFKN